MFIAALFTIARTWKQPRCSSTDEWMKMRYFYRASLVVQLVESTCNAWDPGSIPGSGRTLPGKGIGYPFQYSWASLVAQTVKNLLAMWDIWVGSLGWEDALKPTPVFLPCRISMDRGAWWATVHGVTKSQTWVMGYYLAIKKNEIGSFAVMWMNLESVI